MGRGEPGTVVQDVAVWGAGALHPVQSRGPHLQGQTPLPLVQARTRHSIHYQR